MRERRVLHVARTAPGRATGSAAESSASTTWSASTCRLSAPPTTAAHGVERAQRAEGVAGGRGQRRRGVEAHVAQATVAKGFPRTAGRERRRRRRRAQGRGGLRARRVRRSSRPRFRADGRHLVLVLGVDDVDGRARRLADPPVATSPSSTHQSGRSPREVDGRPCGSRRSIPRRRRARGRGHVRWSPSGCGRQLVADARTVFIQRAVRASSPSLRRRLPTWTSTRWWSLPSPSPTRCAAASPGSTPVGDSRAWWPAGRTRSG